MSQKNQRRKKRQSGHRKKSKSAVKNDSGRSPRKSKSVAWYWYATVVLLALTLFAIFIIFQFDAIDRLAMVGASVCCLGLALTIIGTCLGVGNFDFSQESWVGGFLSRLALLSKPRKRIGEMIYSSRAHYHFFQRILIILVLPLGIILACLRPRQTWPAILLIGLGSLAILGTYVSSLLLAN